MWKLVADGTGASQSDYADRFDRRNLISDGTEWTSWRAFQAAGEMRGTFPWGITVVLLGERVRQAFQLPKMLIHPIEIDGVLYRQIPHPSGRCLFYNDPILRALVALLMRDLYGRQ